MKKIYHHKKTNNKSKYIHGLKNKKKAIKKRKIISKKKINKK